MSGFQPRSSEPGFTGFPDFQDKTLVHQSAIQRTNINLQIGTLESQTHNPENLLILKILVQTKIPENPRFRNNT